MIFHKQYMIGGPNGACALRHRLSPSVPPTEAVIVQDGHCVRLVARTDFFGIVATVSGVVFLAAGIAHMMIQVHYARPLSPVFHGVFLIASVGFSVIGWQKMRTRIECVVEPARRSVHCVRRGSAPGELWRESMDRISVRLHAVSLRRRRAAFAPDWKGYAVCLWQKDKLFMCVALNKRREPCERYMERLASLVPLTQDKHGCVILSRL